ncbi:hypothetical protein [Tychonema sp. BBK16]|uniref:hypothetical protein n=1 Tax=Tychonema sp. BBK16 TaxID=2699888 RepID=UPI001F209896|nr:hypothetical protein [Tychonema sp. BBK16]MCF6374048.1 hypothetical protein [Tychonema sp. BBK16]
MNFTARLTQISLLGLMLFASNPVATFALGSSEPTAATSRTQSPSETIQIASASTPQQLVSNFCVRKGMKVENYFETSNFRIYLCYNRANQVYYYGVKKSNGSTISLRARSEEGTGYVATNGTYDYIVTGANLSVYKKGKLILEQRVIRSL